MNEPSNGVSQSVSCPITQNRHVSYSDPVGSPRTAATNTQGIAGKSTSQVRSGLRANGQPANLRTLTPRTIRAC